MNTNIVNTTIWANNEYRHWASSQDQTKNTDRIPPNEQIIRHIQASAQYKSKQKVALNFVCIFFFFWKSNNNENNKATHKNKKTT